MVYEKLSNKQSHVLNSLLVVKTKKVKAFFTVHSTIAAASIMDGMGGQTAAVSGLTVGVKRVQTRH